MFRKSSPFDSRHLLVSAAVAAIISAAAIGLLDTGYRRQRARATKAIGHYAGLARRKVRKQRLQRRIREPDAIAAVVVAGVGLAAACARLFMRRAGTSAFSSGEDFMTSLATRLPECAIVDIHMPRMSGFDVQTRLLGAKRAVPVIFITASDDETLDAAARQLNVTRVLRKPFSGDALLAAISAELASPPLGP